MRKHQTYTSTLPLQLIKELDAVATKLNTTKKFLIEKAITNYLEELKRLEFVKSFKYANQDKETVLIAEEGIEDYKKMLNK